MGGPAQLSLDVGRVGHHSGRIPQAAGHHGRLEVDTAHFTYRLHHLEHGGPLPPTHVVGDG